METLLIVLATSILTAFFSNFLAPRLNARYDRKYQDNKVLRKTLRILLEIEIYVQRRLKHPVLAIYADALIEKVREKGEASEEQIESLKASAPQAMQHLQKAINEAVPETSDKGEVLQKYFVSVLEELATVEPILAYRISERHIVNPIEQLNTLPQEIAEKLGLPFSADDVQKASPILEKMKAVAIEKSLNDLREDIRNIADKIGKKQREELETFYSDVVARGQELIQNTVPLVFDAAAKSDGASDELTSQT